MKIILKTVDENIELNNKECECGKLYGEHTFSSFVTCMRNKPHIIRSLRYSVDTKELLKLAEVKKNG